MPHKHRKNCNQNPQKEKAKRPKKIPPHSIIDGNASCQTRGSEDPKQKQKQVHTRIVEPGKNKPAKKGIVSWDNNKQQQQQQQPKKGKKDEQTSKQTKTTKQKRREVVLDKHHHDHDHHTISSNSSNNRS
jgi:hypothetical protein